MLASLLEAGRSPELNDPLGELEVRNFALAPDRRITGEGSALVCLRAQPFDHARMMPDSEYVAMSRQFLGIEPYITTECLVTGR